MTLLKVFVVLLSIQLSVCEENIEDSRDGKQAFDWEQNNFGGRTSSKSDALLNRVKVDTDAPKIQNPNNKREGRRNLTRGKHASSRPNKLRFRGLSTDNDLHTNVRARKLRNRIADVIERIHPSRNTVSRNLVNVQENVLRTDSDIEITTRKPFLKVPAVSSTTQSEETELPFLPQNDDREEPTVKEAGVNFLPTMPTIGDIMQTNSTKDEVIVSKTEENSTDISQTTLDTGSEEATTVKTTQPKELSEDVEVFNVTDLIATTKVLKNVDIGDMTTNSPLTNIEPIPMINDPAVAEKLNRLMRKPLRKQEINLENTKDSMVNNEIVTHKRPSSSIVQTDKLAKNIPKASVSKTKMRLRNSFKKPEHIVKDIPAVLEESDTSVKRLRTKSDGQSYEKKETASERRRIPFHRRNRFSAVKKNRTKQTPRKHSLNLIKRMKTRNHQTKQTIEKEESNNEHATVKKSDDLKEGEGKFISKKKQFLTGRRRLHFRKNHSVKSKDKSKFATKRREGVGASPYRRRRPQAQETTSISTTTDKVSTSTTLTTTSTTTTSTTSTTTTTTEGITINPDAHKIKFTAEEMGTTEKTSSGIEIKIEEPMIPFAMPQKQMLPIPSDMFSQATHHLMRTKNIRLKHGDDNMMSKLINRGRDRFHKRAKNLHLRSKNTSDKLSDPEAETIEDSEHKEEDNISNNKRGRYILAATTLG